jgi:hypothetical protein
MISKVPASLRCSGFRRLNSFAVGYFTILPSPSTELQCIRKFDNHPKVGADSRAWMPPLHFSLFNSGSMCEWKAIRAMMRASISIRLSIRRIKLVDFHRRDKSDAPLAEKFFAQDGVTVREPECGVQMSHHLLMMISFVPHLT